MKSNISNEGGRLSGTWSEKNFGLEGDIDGSLGVGQQIEHADHRPAARVDDGFRERRDAQHRYFGEWAWL